MQIDTSSLKPHPLNSKIYSNGNTEDLEVSIQENGLLDPIIISKDNTIISGHRRWNACKNIGLENVDVRVEDFQDETIALVELNRYRNKKASELLAEIFLLEKEYKKKIKRGRRKKGDNIVPINQGRIREKIAKLTGVSSGNLSKLKYIHRVWPDIISLIDDGKVTINQAYTESKRKEVFKNIQVSPKNGVKKSDKTAITDRFKIYNKSSMDMSELEDGSVQTIMTSPPYFNQRNYGYDEQIGLEKTIDEYIENLMKVFDECHRVLSPQGSLFLNIGDKYVNGELMSLPHCIAIRMMDGGWIQRNCIIWKKTNPKPEAVTNRFHNSYEFIFFFTKSKGDYYFDSDSIRQPYKHTNGLKDVRAPRHHSLKGDFSVNSPVFQNPKGKLPQDYIDIVETAKCSYGVGKELGIENLEHGAVFPEQICVNPIKSTSREDDLVLDPFMGSGTVGEVSLRLKRKFCGYELNPQFCKLSELRLSKIN